MKIILKTTMVVFLLIGSIVTIQSCEENLSIADQNMLRSAKLSKVTSVTTFSPVSGNVVTVTDCNLNGWLRFGAPGASGTIKLVDGPSIPTLGNGSVQFICPDQILIRLNNNFFNDTKLSNISKLSYSTYVQQSGSIADNIFIVIQLDINNDGIVDFPVVFNPIFQTGDYVQGLALDQGATLMNKWQTWDLLNGVWWRGPAPDPMNGGALFTLASLLNQYPNTIITNQGDGPGSIRIGGGSPVFTGEFIGYADNFNIGINGVTTTYDFEGRTANAGPDQTVIYGYHSNCTTLYGSAAGGIEPYVFSWSPVGSTPNQVGTEVCPTATTTRIATLVAMRLNVRGL